MNQANGNLTILIAEDDPDDRLLAEEALAECNLTLKHELRFVEDGEELMNYLNRRGAYNNAPLPGLILLDLNMPRKDGREVLKEINASPHLRKVPIVVLTTSKAEEDIARSYNLGVNSYIVKPLSFNGLVEVMRTLAKYWLEIVERPPH